jgi:diguanylate cyclase (GGDEF)-like protein
MIDIDDFKVYNDTYGHIKGDNLIKQVSEIIKNNVRQVDVVGRYGGEEFIVIFPETENKIAIETMENIRKEIEQKSFEGEEKIPNKKITISVGLATCMDKTLTEDEIIDIADKLLYKAKSSGKNKIMSNIIVDKNLKVDVQEVNEFYKKH